MALVQRALALAKPALGICLGCQMLAAVLGAKVRPAEAPEIRWLPVQLEPQRPRCFDESEEADYCRWNPARRRPRILRTVDMARAFAKSVRSTPVGGSRARGQPPKLEAHRFGARPEPCRVNLIL